LFPIIQRISNQHKILRFLDTNMQKIIEFFRGSLSTNRVYVRNSKNANSQEMA